MVIEKELKPPHRKNDVSLITDVAKLTEVRDVQESKACGPIMHRTLKTNEVNKGSEENAYSSI